MVTRKKKKASRTLQPGIVEFSGLNRQKAVRISSVESVTEYSGEAILHFKSGEKTTVREPYKKVIEKLGWLIELN